VSRAVGLRAASGGAGPITAPPAATADRVGRRVHRALEKLPEHQRALIELAYWSELSQSDIATCLSIPLEAVRTRMSAALADLADLLGLTSP
jgi:RNA polymerase sigma-70 factor (ECF subfamily)